MTRAQSLLALAGRMALAPIFLGAGVHKLSHWEETRALVADAGLPAANALVAGAVAVLLAGGTAVLFGYRARLGAALLALFLVPTTLVFHDFWTHADVEREMQLAHLLKNLGLFGGLLLLAAFGAGGVALDAQRRGR